uniref:PRKR-interacting protein 1 n=1 Tax=Aceria tosichella TaxID=561515 RepID=A0A6G1SIM1_9ACAR
MALNAKDKDMTYDNQRRKIEKLMENPRRVIDFPNSSMSNKKSYEPPEFVRNVMGSSAGAGSGEFHVYRHLRRKEMTRLKQLEEMSHSERLDAEFKSKLEETKRKAQERTMKKKMKREKKRKKSNTTNK